MAAAIAASARISKSGHGAEPSSPSPDVSVPAARGRSRLLDGGADARCVPSTSPEPESPSGDGALPSVTSAGAVVTASSVAAVRAMPAGGVLIAQPSEPAVALSFVSPLRCALSTRRLDTPSRRATRSADAAANPSRPARRTRTRRSKPLTA